MKRRISMAAGLVGLLFAIGAGPAAGQSCQACEGCVACCTTDWHSSDLTVIDGVVSSVERRGEGRHLIVDTPDGVVTVHVGPVWYLDRQDETLEVGDEISVTGLRVDLEEGPALVAREVRKGEAVLTLRGADGYPSWQAWRGGHHRGHHHACSGRGCQGCRPRR